MTVQEILSNEPLRQREFPVCRSKKFFGHAGVCPLPKRVSEAIRNYASSCTLGDQETLIPSFQIKKSRQLAANILGSKPEEIAFVGPTSLGLSYVASGLTFEKGDNVVAYFDDYPSNVYPWMTLQEKGVEVRFIKTEQYGRIGFKDVQALCDNQTKLVALASNHYISGFRINIEEIGSFLRKKGILFCLDAIQTVGAFKTSVQYVDFLAADAHKWLLGPCAAGILYVRQEVQERLRPVVYGWHNVVCPGFIAQPTVSLFQDARRYEVGTENLLGLVGLHASMELLLEIGIENISTELLRKRDGVVPTLEGKGYSVLQSGATREEASSIISFLDKNKDMSKLHRELEEKGFITSLRGNRYGENYIRISPHFYNTDQELQELLSLL